MRILDRGDLVGARDEGFALIPRVGCQDLENPIPIENLYRLFGENLPYFLQYEGGSRPNYLFCVDSNIDVKTICGQNGYEYHSLYTLEIDPCMYTNEYTIHPTYSKDGPKYVLEKTV